MTRRKRCIAIIILVIMTLLNVEIYFAKNDEKSEIVLPVLMYHNLAEEYPDGTEAENITPELFEAHMRAILDRGYTPILVNEYYNYIIKGKDLPQKPIAITFDDGYLSNYEIAYPILKKLNIPATIFVVTSTVGLDASSKRVSTPHFSWEQAREMQNSGLIDIHSHSYSHKDMTSLSAAQLQLELRMSKYMIERNMGKNCYIFAYPYGRYSDQTLMYAKAAGYRMQILVYNSESGEVNLANKASDGIEHFIRLTISGDMSVNDLYDKIDLAVKNTIEKENIGTVESIQ